MSRSQWERLCQDRKEKLAAEPKPKWAPKYHSKRCELDGHKFPSLLERDLYVHLRLLEKLGEITDIELQPKVYLTLAKILYKPDFKALCLKRHTRIFYESKGAETSEWRIKRRLWLYYGDGTLYVYKRSGRTLKMTEELTPYQVTSCQETTE